MTKIFTNGKVKKGKRSKGGAIWERGWNYNNMVTLGEGIEAVRVRMDLVSEKETGITGVKRKLFPEKSNPRVREEGHLCLFRSPSDQWPSYAVPRIYDPFSPSHSLFTARAHFH